MQGDPQRFIELVTRDPDEPGQDGDAIEFAAWLHRDAGNDEGLPDAIRRLESTKAKRFKSLPAWLAGLLLTALALAFAILLPRYWKEAVLLSGVHGFSSIAPSYREFDFALEELGIQDPVLAGLGEIDTDSGRWETIGEYGRRHPDSPAAYWTYALPYSHYEPDEVLPPDFEETWSRLDPFNSIWALLAADRFAAKALGLAARPSEPDAIKDEESARIALALLRKASPTPRTHGFGQSLVDRLAPPDHTSLKQLHAKATLQRRMRDRGVEIAAIYRLTAVEAKRLHEASDTEGLSRLIGDLREALQISVAHGNYGPEVGLYIFNRHGPELYALCQSAELDAEAEWLKRMTTLSAGLKGRLSPWAAKDPKAATLGLRYTPHTLVNDDEWRPAEWYKPERMAEIAVADRYALLLGWIATFFISLALGVEILRRGASANAVARRMGPLFQARDWLHVAAWGILLPVAWWAGFVWFTPAGCRDIAAFRVWFLQDAALLILIATCSFQVIRWRWTRRLRFLGPRRIALWDGWAVAGMTALIIPFADYQRMASDPDYIPAVYCTMLGIPLLWLLWRWLMICLTPRAGSLHGLLWSRTALQAALGASLIFPGAIFALHSAERHWLAADQALRPAPNGSGDPMIIHRAMEPVRSALLEALESPIWER